MHIRKKQPKRTQQRKKGSLTQAIGAPSFSLQVGFPLKEEDALVHPMAYQPSKSKLKANFDLISRRNLYAERFRFSLGRNASKRSHENSAVDEAIIDAGPPMVKHRTTEKKNTAEQFDADDTQIEVLDQQPEIACSKRTSRAVVEVIDCLRYHDSETSEQRIDDSIEVLGQQRMEPR